HHEIHAIGKVTNVDLALANAYCLDKDDVEEVEKDADDLKRGGAQSAERGIRGLAPEIDARVAGGETHPRAIAEQRAAGDMARGIDRDNGDAYSFAHLTNA